MRSLGVKQLLILTLLLVPALAYGGTTPDDDTVGATTLYTVNFQLGGLVPPDTLAEDGSITIEFDADFVLGSTMIATPVSGIDGGFLPAAPVNQTVTFERDGTGSLVTSNATVEIQFGNVTNHTTPGNYSVTISYTGGTGTPLDVNAQSFDIVAGPLDHFTVSDPTPPTIAGSDFEITISAFDEFDNAITFNGTVNLTDDTGTLTPASPSMSGTTLTVSNANITTAQNNVQITATGDGKSGISNEFNVTHGALDHFALSTISSPQTAGEGFPLTITAQDANDNTVTSFNGTVSFSTTTGSITPETSGNFSDGVRTESITFGSVGSGTATIGVSDSDGSGASGSSNSFDVVAGALDHFTVSSPGTATAGANFSFTVAAFDANNNEVSFPGTVDLVDNTGTLSPTSVDFSGATEVTISNAKITKAQSGVRITASEADGVVGQSASFTVNPAELDHFAVTNTSGGNIATQTAGTAFDIRITAQDEFDNTVTSSGATVELSDSTTTISPTTATLSSGTTTETVTITRSGVDIQITAGDGAISGQSNPFTVNPGALDSFTIDPIGGQATNTAFPITVTAIDANGNTVTGFTGTVGINDLTTTISPDISDSFSDGRWTGNVTITQVRTDNEISVQNSAGLQTGTSNSFDVSSTTVDHFAISAIATQTAGESFNITITAQDASNNTVTGFTNTVNLSDETGTLSPTLSANFVKGVLSNFPVTITRAVANNNIAATGSGKSGESNAFDVNPAELDHFDFATISSPQVAGQAFDITVTAKDAFDNTITDFGSQVTLDDNTGTITPGTMGSFNAGQRTESVTITQTALDNRITATSGGVTSQSGFFNVTSAGVVSFDVSGISSPQTAGAPFSVTITAKDGANGSGNTVTSFNGNVNLSLIGGTGGTLTPTSVTASNGTWTGNVEVLSINGDPAGKILHVDDGSGNTGDSNTFTVNPGPLDRFTVSSPTPNPAVAGDFFSFTVAAFDANNNSVSFSGTVELDDNTGTLSPSSVSFTDDTNVTVNNATITKAQSGVRITANGGGAIGQSPSFTVNPAALDHFAVTNATGGNISSQTAGTPFDIRITAQDAFNNTVTSFNSTVGLTDDTGTLTPSTSGALSSGTTTETVTITQSGVDIQITAQGGGSSGQSNAFTVNPGSLASFTIDPISDQATNEPFPITVTAIDANNNTVTSFTGTVVISDLTTTISPTASGNFSSGRWTGNVTITQARISNEITVQNSAGLQTGTSNPFDVSSTTIDHFTISAIASPQTAGQPFNITVTAEDASNNTVTGFTGTVNLDDETGTLDPPISGNFVDGVLTNFPVTITASQTNNMITVTGLGKSGESNAFDVDPAALDHFEFVAIPSPQVAGQAFDITLTAKDAFDNTVTGFTDQITLTDNTGTITPGTTNNFIAGQLTQSVVITQTALDNLITATFGSVISQSNFFNITAQGVVSFAISNIASPKLAGDPFLVTITAKDDTSGTGNTVTSFNGSVDLSLLGTGGTLTPTSTTAFSNGAWTGNVRVLSINSDPDGKILHVDDGLGHVGDSNPFTVKPGAPVGAVTLTANPQVLPADGVSLSQITSDSLKDANDNFIGSGRQFTVTLDPAGRGQITTDSNPVQPGTQVVSGVNSSLDFSYQAGSDGGSVRVVVQSDSGNATGDVTLTLGSLSITSVSAAPAFVSQGQTSVEVVMIVQNSGASTISGISGNNSTLTFTDRTNSIDRTGDYIVTRVDQIDTIPPGGQQQLQFAVDVRASATIDTIDIDGSVTGTVGGQPVSVAGAAITDAWIVQQPAQLLAVSVTSPGDTVTVGNKDNALAVNIQNPAPVGSASLIIDTIQLRFLQNGATDQSVFFIVEPDPNNPISIGAGQTRAFAFDVDVGSSTPTGDYEVDVTVTGHDTNDVALTLQDTEASTRLDWFVKSAPNFQIISLTTEPTQAFNAGQPNPGNILMEVSNNGPDDIVLDLDAGATFVRLFRGITEVTGEYSIDQPTALLTSGDDTLRSLSTDILVFPVAQAGTTVGTITIEGTVSGADLGTGQPIDDNTSDGGKGEFEIKSQTGTVFIENTEPNDNTPNVQLQIGQVNTGQEFVVDVSIKNSLDETVDTVLVDLSSSGSSQIQQSRILISSIAANATATVTYQVIASSQPGEETFIADIFNAGVGRDTQQPANEGPPVDNDAIFTIETPANISVDLSAEDVSLAAEDTFSVTAQVTNAGQARIDDSGELTLSLPDNYTLVDDGTGRTSLTAGFAINESVVWRILSPAFDSQADSFIVNISELPSDENTGLPANVASGEDTIVVQTSDVDLTITSFEVTAPAGATDDTVSTQQDFTVTAEFTRSPNIEEVRATLGVPSGVSIKATSPNPRVIPTGVTVTWQLQVEDQTGPLQLSVDMVGFDGGQDVADDSAELTVLSVTRAELQLSFRSDLASNIASIDQEFNLIARLTRVGVAGVTDGEITLDLSNSGVTLRNQEPAAKVFNLGDNSQIEVSWPVKAPSAPSGAPEQVSISITQIPKDENSGQDARFVGNNTVETLEIETTDLGTISISDFIVSSPGGAADGGLSTGQLFTVKATVTWNSVKDRVASISFPNGYVVPDGIISKQSLLDVDSGTEEFTWTLQAPTDVRATQEAITVRVTGKDIANESRELDDETALLFTVVSQASLQLAASITDPLPAIGGVLTEGLLFTVTATLDNTGGATVTGQDTLRLTLPEGYSLEGAQPLERPITAGGQVSWQIRAPETPHNSPRNIRVEDLKRNIRDVNTDDLPPLTPNNPARVTIPVITRAISLETRLLTQRKPVTITRGAENVQLFGLSFTNISDAVIEIDSISLELFDLEQNPLPPNAVFDQLSVRDYVAGTPVFATVSPLPGSNPIILAFNPPLTVGTGADTTRAIEFVVNIRQQTEVEAFQLMISSPASQIVARVKESNKKVLITDDAGRPLDIVVPGGTRVVDSDFETSFFNYPNPIGRNETTSFNYNLTQNSDGTLRIYTLLGELVWSTTFTSGEILGQAGNHDGVSLKTITWDGRNGKGQEVRNGVYIAVLTTSAGEAVTKVAIAK